MSHMSHEIISISLDPETSALAIALQQHFKTRGRSDLIRLALRNLQEERKEHMVAGKITGVLLLVHHHRAAAEVIQIIHEFQPLVETQLHTNTKQGCFEIVVVKGEAKDVHEMLHRFQQTKQIQRAKLVVA